MERTLLTESLLPEQFRSVPIVLVVNTAAAVATATSTPSAATVDGAVDVSRCDTIGPGQRRPQPELQSQITQRICIRAAYCIVRFSPSLFALWCPSFFEGKRREICGAKKRQISRKWWFPGQHEH